MASDEMKMGRNNGNRESPAAADDDWERMIDNGSLDRAIEKLSMKNSSKGGVSDAEKDLNEAPKVQVHLEEPPTRTPFTPMVRILKRETKPKSAANNELGLSNANGATPAQKTPPTAKTFAQRQDEYLRARARIMGSQSTNAPVVPNGNVRTTTLLDSSNNRHQDGQQQQQQQQQHQPTQQQQQLLQSQPHQQQQQQQLFHRERRANGR